VSAYFGSISIDYDEPFPNIYRAVEVYEYLEHISGNKEPHQPAGSIK
jgi:hypothetical protein